MTKKKHQSPAKAHYDEKHPIVSFRCTPALKKKLDVIKKMSDKNVADILKEAVELQAPSAKYAYKKGGLVAELTYAVHYRCSGCGKVMTINTDEEKKAAGQYMQEHGWSHASCIKKQWQAPLG
jgi:hypothetical protein